MVISEFWKQEVEPGEQADYKEKNQGVGYCQEESGNNIFPIGVGLGQVRSPEVFGGVFAEEENAEQRDCDRPENLEKKLLRRNEVGNESNAGAGENTVEKVGD